MSTFYKSALALALFTSVGAACSGSNQHTETAADHRNDRETTTVSQAQREALDTAVSTNQDGGLNLSPDVAALCPEVRPPHFGYNSAQVQGEWETALRALARCMDSGGLRGRAVLLTGHTDPRGEDDYNLALGGRRAESVKGAITSFGVAGARVEVTSRGEVDARGTDESSWAQDRRVDVTLRPGS